MHKCKHRAVLIPMCLKCVSWPWDAHRGLALFLLSLCTLLRTAEVPLEGLCCSACGSHASHRHPLLRNGSSEITAEPSLDGVLWSKIMCLDALYQHLNSNRLNRKKRQCSQLVFRAFWNAKHRLLPLLNVLLGVWLIRIAIMMCCDNKMMPSRAHMEGQSRINGPGTS